MNFKLLNYPTQRNKIPSLRKIQRRHRHHVPETAQLLPIQQTYEQP